MHCFCSLPLLPLCVNVCVVAAVSVYKQKPFFKVRRGVINRVCRQQAASSCPSPSEAEAEPPTHEVQNNTTTESHTYLQTGSDHTHCFHCAQLGLAKEQKLLWWQQQQDRQAWQGLRSQRGMSNRGQCCSEGERTGPVTRRSPVQSLASRISLGGECESVSTCLWLWLFWEISGVNVYTCECLRETLSGFLWCR